MVAVAAIATVGVGSAGASAAEWRVGGSPLVGSTELASAVTTSSSWKFSNSDGMITCTKLSIQEGLISSPASGSIKALVFTGCTNSNEKTCRVPREIKSKPLTIGATLGSTSPKDNLLLSPASGSVFLEFEYAGEECSLSPVQQYKGKATVQLPTGQEQKTEQELVANTPTGELSSPLPTIFTGAGKIKLKSAKAFSFS